jgi:hypothetical protein
VTKARRGSFADGQAHREAEPRTGAAEPAD